MILNISSVLFTFTSVSLRKTIEPTWVKIMTIIAGTGRLPRNAKLMTKSKYLKFLTKI
jgi:hypothetical protein